MEKAVEIRKLINHPVEKVYLAWTTPERFAKWFLPGPDVQLGAVRADLRVGGEFLIEMRVGEQSLPHVGVYQRLVQNKELVFTWKSAMTDGQDTLVEVQFEPMGSGRTMLTLRHTGLREEASSDAHRHGWTRIIDGIEPLLEAP